MSPTLKRHQSADDIESSPSKRTRVTYKDNITPAKRQIIERVYAPSPARRIRFVSAESDNGYESDISEASFQEILMLEPMLQEQTATTTQQPCHLLNLSVELRNQIYRLALVEEKPLMVDNHFKEVYRKDYHIRRGNITCAPCGGPLYYEYTKDEEQTPVLSSPSGFGLLATNKQIYNECVSIAYGENTFTANDTSSMLLFVIAIGNCAAALRTATVITNYDFKNLVENLGTDIWMDKSELRRSRMIQFRGLLNMLYNQPHFKRINLDLKTDWEFIGSGLEDYRNAIFYYLETNVLDRPDFLQKQKVYESIHLRWRQEDALKKTLVRQEDCCLACITAAGAGKRSKLEPCKLDCLKLGAIQVCRLSQGPLPIRQKSASSNLGHCASMVAGSRALDPIILD